MRGWLPAALIVLLTLAAYLPALRGDFVWDDERYASNPLLEKPGGLRDILTLRETPEPYYKDVPMVYVSFWLERRLWGLRPAGYHLSNILLHALNAILVWLLLSRLGLPLAWLAGAIFALHPVHVESVAWITERKNVLSGFFYLLALGAYFRHEEGEGPRWYRASLGLFLLSLLSKPVTCTMPVVLILLRWARGLKTGRREIMDLAPFFLLSLAVGLFTLWVETRVVGGEIHRSAFRLSWAQNVLLACRALWFYPLKLLWPSNLAFSYERWTLDAADPSQWLWVAATLAAAALLWQFKRRLGRGFLAVVGFYVVTIAPMLGVANVYTFRYSFVADHYQYLASLGLLAVAAAGIGRLASGRAARIAAGGALLAVLGAATWAQTKIYENSKALWSDTLSKNPKAFIAHNNLGVILAAEGRTDEAIAHYREALALEPKNMEARNNLGLALASQGRLEEAVADYREALAFDRRHPAINNNLGLALARLGRLEEAETHFRRALAANTDYVEAHSNLAAALLARGRFEEAAAHCLKALSLDPAHVNARRNLELSRARLNRAQSGHRS